MPLSAASSVSVDNKSLHVALQRMDFEVCERNSCACGYHLVSLDFCPVSILVEPHD